MVLSRLRVWKHGRLGLTPVVLRREQFAAQVFILLTQTSGFFSTQADRHSAEAASTIYERT